MFHSGCCTQLCLWHFCCLATSFSCAQGKLLLGIFKPVSEEADFVIVVSLILLALAVLGAPLFAIIAS